MKDGNAKGGTEGALRGDGSSECGSSRVSRLLEDVVDEVCEGPIVVG